MRNLFKKKPAVCFATNELFPVDRGGIGRMLHNFAIYNRDSGKTTEIHFLVGGDLARDGHKVRQLTQYMKKIATIHVVPDLKLSNDILPHLLGYAASASRFGPENVLAASYEFYLGLLDAEHKMGRPFDLVEFPDFGGWGKVSLEAKRAGMAFQQTELTVRIHSTQGILYRIERYAHIGGAWLASQFDAEQISMKYADRIIGHIPAVLDYTLTHYGLDEYHRTSSQCEFPPIFTTDDEVSYAGETATSNNEPNFIFSSRLQHFKRPDLFVRAAITFLDKYPEYGGKFLIASYGWDDEYIQMLVDLVPVQHAKNIIFKLELTSDERLDDISRSVVVQPSDYESLCLFAYEASTMGRPVILNAACLAFGECERWKDGDNCLFFDGTVPGLVATMEKARSWRPSSQVDVVPDEPYWTTLGKNPNNGKHSDASASSRFTAIFFDLDTPSDLQRLRRNVVHLRRIVQDASLHMSTCLVMLQKDNGYDPQDIAKLEELGIEVVLAPSPRFDPKTLEGLIKTRSEDDIVLLVPGSVQLTEVFITNGIRTLSANREISLLGAHLDVYDETSGHVTELRTYFGEAFNSAAMSGRVMSPMLFLRGQVVGRVPFDFRAGALWFEAFARSAVLAGENMLVMPLIGGRMDFNASLKPDDSNKLTSAVLDEYGIRSGLSARLLSLELKKPERSESISNNLLSDGALATTSRLSPTAAELPWNPIEFHRELGGLLVHPLEGQITIGILPVEVHNPSLVKAVVRNANKRNFGGEVALAYGSGRISAEKLSSIIVGKVESDEVVVGNWLEVPPGETTSYFMRLPPYIAQEEGRTLYFVSRPIEGKSSDQCHLIFSKVAFGVR